MDILIVEDKPHDLGLNSCVAKPVPFDALVKAVQQMGLYGLLLNHPPEN